MPRHSVSPCSTTPRLKTGRNARNALHACNPNTATEVATIAALNKPADTSACQCRPQISASANSTPYCGFTTRIAMQTPAMTGRDRNSSNAAAAAVTVRNAFCIESAAPMKPGNAATTIRHWPSSGRVSRATTAA